MQPLKYHMYVTNDLAIEFLKEQPAFLEFVGHQLLESKEGIAYFTTESCPHIWNEMMIPVCIPTGLNDLRDCIDRGEYSTIMVHASGPNPSILGQGDDAGQTVLHHAVKNNAVILYEPLIQSMHTSDIFKPSTSMHTVLHCAIRCSQSGHEFITCLAKLKPEVLRELAKIGDCYGDSPLHYAAVAQGTYESLFDYADHAALLTLNHDGLSVLHLAITNGNMDLVRLLLSDRDLADKLVSIRDPKGQTVLDLATHIPPDIMALLYSASVRVGCLLDQYTDSMPKLGVDRMACD